MAERRCKTIGKRQASDALAAVHETARGLREAGAIDEQSMRDLDEMCLAPGEERAPGEARSAYPTGRSRSGAGLRGRRAGTEG